ncbi:MAG: DsbA family oxidoreductase [Candidatus Izimaplasma sp.]|nr:DsbA family oxidoreductase [Candidatus Izimaplasma bacterium]
MKIELWSDFACPFCYIGKTRFENALAKFPHKEHVEVIYKAYQLNPNAPKKMTSSPAEAFAKGHGMTVDKAKERFTMFTENAKTVGLEYHYDVIQMTNTFDAHRLAKWANKQNKEPEITARFMKAYFTEGKNLSDVETLVELTKEIGLKGDKAREILNTDTYSDTVKSQITEGRQVGVQGVPFFVLNRKYGVSGAQQEEYFTQVLEKLWEEEKPLETIGDDGNVCTEDKCEI